MADEAPLIGKMHEASLRGDPKHLIFVGARYKFVGKMMRPTDSVLEVGCGDGTGSRWVKQFAPNWFGIDRREQNLSPSEFKVHDIIKDGPFDAVFDAVYALDVLEHIDPKYEDLFFMNIKQMMYHDAVCIIGMPSFESQVHASPQSKAEHVNCKTEAQFKETLFAHFSNVFTFGMNDETLHTGFGPMCHYRLGIALK